MAAHVSWRAQPISRSSFRNEAKHATPLEGCSPGWLEGSDAHRALNKSEHLGRRERSRRARARAARSYLKRPLLYGATNGGAEVGRRKDANSDARYRAQKHVSDQAMPDATHGHQFACARHALEAPNKQAPTEKRRSESLRRCGIRCLRWRRLLEMVSVELGVACCAGCDVLPAFAFVKSAAGAWSVWSMWP